MKTSQMTSFLPAGKDSSIAGISQLPLIMHWKLSSQDFSEKEVKQKTGWEEGKKSKYQDEQNKVSECSHPRRGLGGRIPRNKLV